MQQFSSRMGVILLLLMLGTPEKAYASDFGGTIGVRTLGYTAGGKDRRIDSIQGNLRYSRTLSDALTFDLRAYGHFETSPGGHYYIDPTVARLVWRHGSWQATLGYDLVHWGVTESRNVVNAINQRDQIQDIQGDRGLGQQMFALRYFSPSFSIEGFVLPGFRPLDHGSDERRWGLPFLVDDSRATYESARGKHHVDFAMRVSGMAGDLEYGLSLFDGTLRQPQLRLDPVRRKLLPHYQLGRQFGLDLQYTTGATILKFEGIHVIPRSGRNYQSVVWGFEHVLSSTFGQPWETAVFVEHNWDSRGNGGTILYQNDLFLGLRTSFGDLRETRLTMGGIFDLDHGGVLGSIKFSRRINQSLSFSADYNFVMRTNRRNVLHSARNLDHISIGLDWSF